MIFNNIGFLIKVTRVILSTAIVVISLFSGEALALAGDDTF